MRLPESEDDKQNNSEDVDLSFEDKIKEKGFLEIKVICSLIRLFEFFYSLDDMKKDLKEEGFDKIENCLRLFSHKVC